MLSVNQPTKIQVIVGVFREQLISQAYGTAALAAEPPYGCFGWSLWGRGGRLEVAGQLLALAHTLSPSTSCWVWPGSTMERLPGVSRHTALPQGGHKRQQYWQGFKNQLSALQNHHALHIDHITRTSKLRAEAQKSWCLCRWCCLHRGFAVICTMWC